MSNAIPRSRPSSSRPLTFNNHHDDPYTLDLVAFEQLAGSPVEAPAMRAMAELLEKGWAGYSTLGWDDQVAALMDGSMVCAAICYRIDNPGPVAFVRLGFTDPACQERGLYKALFTAWSAALAERRPEVLRIDSGFHVDNVASAAMHASLGRKVVALSTVFELQRPQP